MLLYFLDSISEVDENYRHLAPSTLCESKKLNAAQTIESMKGTLFMVTPFVHKIHAILQMMGAVFCMLENVLSTSVLPERAL
jgi:hypothetical protein